jgi:signal transduction histidine kinase
MKKHLNKIFLLIIIFTFNQSGYCDYLMVTPDLPVSGNSKYDTLILRSAIIFYKNPDSAISILKNARNIAINQNEIEWQIRCNSLLGFMYEYMIKHDSAFFFNNLAFSLAAKINDYEQMGNCYNNISITHWFIGNYKDAFTCMNKALEYYNKSGSVSGKIKTLLNIGICYAKCNNYKQAKQYFFDSYMEIQKNKDSTYLRLIYTNFGFLYLNLSDMDSALFYFNKAIPLHKQANDNPALCRLYDGLGKVFLNNNNYDEAQKNFLLCKSLAEETGFVYAQAYAYVGMSEVALSKKKFAESIVYAENSLHLASFINDNDLFCKIYSVLSRAYEFECQYEKALENSRIFDSLKNHENTQNKIIQAYGYDIQQINEKSQSEIQQLLIEKQELQLSRKNNMILFISLISIIVFISSIIFFRENQQHQKLLLQNSNLLFAEKRSKAIIAAEIQERSRIGQELHDGLGQMLTVARFNVSVLQQKASLTEERRKELIDSAIHSVDEAFNELRNISHNLAPTILSEKGFIGALEELSEQINRSSNLRMQLEVYGLNGSLDKLVENTLYRSVQELLNNAMKHAQANYFFLQIIKSETEITLMFEDNGKGFNFEKTLISTGSGLTNIRCRVENMHGNIFIDSKENRGTIVTIVIPTKT